MKYIWVIEKQDSGGEFQPFGGGYYLSREEANAGIDSIKSMSAGRFRVMKYIQQVIHA